MRKTLVAHWSVSRSKSPCLYWKYTTCSVTCSWLLVVIAKVRTVLAPRFEHRDVSRRFAVSAGGPVAADRCSRCCVQPRNVKRPRSSVTWAVGARLREDCSNLHAKSVCAKVRTPLRAHEQIRSGAVRIFAIITSDCWQPSGGFAHVLHDGSHT